MNTPRATPSSLLLQRVQTAGEQWAELVRKRTHGESRRAAGGWPGTMSEARSLLAGVLAEPHPRGESDTEELAQLLYGSAKKWWNDRQDPLPK